MTLAIDKKTGMASVKKSKVDAITNHKRRHFNDPNMMECFSYEGEWTYA